MPARAVLPIVIVLLALLAPAGSADGGRSVTAYYVGPGDLLWASVQGNNVGGASFTPNRWEDSVTITAIDSQAGNAVTITVCQDTNQDGVCGDVAAGEPGIIGCGTAMLSKRDARPFNPAFEVVVFVHAAGSAFRDGCPTLQPATTGYLDATFR